MHLVSEAEKARIFATFTPLQSVLFDQPAPHDDDPMTEPGLLRIADRLQEYVDRLEFDHRIPSMKPPTKKLKSHKIAEALQSEATFTTAKHKKHIVATYGCGPCVAVGGYDRINKIAFIVHFATAEEVRKCGGQILYNIASLAKKKITKPIKIHLRGGVKGQSEETIKAIKTWMERREDLPMKVASEDILASGMDLGGKSLAISAKTGKVFEYDPLLNPKSRKITDKIVAHALMSAFIPDIRISHRPKLKAGVLK